MSNSGDGLVNPLKASVAANFIAWKRSAVNANSCFSRFTQDNKHSYIHSSNPTLGCSISCWGWNHEYYGTTTPRPGTNISRWWKHVSCDRFLMVRREGRHFSEVFLLLSVRTEICMTGNSNPRHVRISSIFIHSFITKKVSFICRALIFVCNKHFRFIWKLCRDVLYAFGRG